MGRRHHATTQPTTMIHHIREIQLRLLSVVGVLIIGMIVGYVYYEPLFEFMKAPLNAPLHYMSPAGSFTFIIKICLMVGTVVALPVVVYNIIMFVQPALQKRLSRLRVYLTTAASLLLAVGGGAFGYFVILPLALRFFYKFQVDGLVAIISADEYFRFVVSVIVTFVLIFQLPLLMSLADHITPLPPKKLLKFEKYIIVGSIFIGVVVPFALDPTVQLLIASPIIILYNLSIVIVALQHYVRRRAKNAVRHKTTQPLSVPRVADAPMPRPVVDRPVPQPVQIQPVSPIKRPVVTQSSIKQSQRRSIDGTMRPRLRTAPVVAPVRSNATPIVKPRSAPSRRLITDMRPTSRPAVFPSQSEQKGLA